MRCEEEGREAEWLIRVRTGEKMGLGSGWLEGGDRLGSWKPLPLQCASGEGWGDSSSPATCRLGLFPSSCLSVHALVLGTRSFSCPGRLALPPLGISGMCLPWGWRLAPRAGTPGKLAFWVAWQNRLQAPS